MIQKEFATLACVAVAIGMFFVAQRISVAEPLDPDTLKGDRPSDEPIEDLEPLPETGDVSGRTTNPSVAAAIPNPTPTPTAVITPQPVKAQPQPVKAQPQPVKAQPQPIKAQPQPVKAQPQPIKPQPQPVKPQPQPIKAQPSPVAPIPPVVARNPDDSPERTKSGKVSASKDATRPPAFGPEAPKVRVLVLSDFQCPVCRRAVDATHQIAEEFPGEVRVEFWQHPLKMHRNAAAAAAASLAAHRQGKFWEYHDLLFANQRALDNASLERYAVQLKLNLDTFKKDMADPTLRAEIAAQSGLARAVGARGTPAFLINGKLAVGWGSWNGFRGQVLRELTQARVAATQGKGDHKALELARVAVNLTDAEHQKKYAEVVFGGEKAKKK